MKILLLNDNATLNHVGCQAVSDAIARRIGELGHTIVSRFFLGEVYRFRRSTPEEGVAAVLADEEICDQIGNVDVVICNGEGSIHHGAGTELLAVLGAAQRLGKPTLLFNTVFEETPGWESVLLQLLDFTVRDHRSLAYSKSLGVSARFVPDISLEAKYVLHKQISLAGKDVLTDWHPLRTDVEAIIRGYASERTATEKFYLPLHSRDTAEMWRSLPSMLSDCRVLLTARHHGAYMAALCGCPFVLLGSNTHKMEGILDMFPGLPFCRSRDDLPAAIEYAVANKALFTTFAHTMAAMLPLSHFERLGRGDTEPSAARELERLELDLAVKRSKVFSDTAMLVSQRSAEFFGSAAAVV
ncbi:polysaccharide pyruvyl transferase family protein [Ensifer adhaerens]|uniref:polysaccharide pyruvyl transferase family protein n=1 Tax=Ensifer adhaerens TaxID=106592 RepID=UPI0008074231|nr:polysaccharide pyruvyl transferase family protein [Ensifer adhaerens]